MSQKNQGEDNKEAAKEYNEATKNFVESGGVETNKDQHKNLSDEEKRKLREAEEKGKDKAKE
jgi:hypothetical protein